MDLGSKDSMATFGMSTLRSHNILSGSQNMRKHRRMTLVSNQIIPIPMTFNKETYCSVVLDFMNQTINYMDSLDWIERYAWFGYFVSGAAVFDHPSKLHRN